MLTVLGGLAEFERELIIARTGEGRTRAKARGVKFGRPAALTPHQRREAMQRLANGEAQADVARSFNVSQATISRLAAPKLQAPPPACAHDAIRACYARDFPGLQLIHTVADVNKLLNIAAKKNHENPMSQRSPRQCLLIGHGIFRQNNRSYRDR